MGSPGWRKNQAASQTTMVNGVVWYDEMKMDVSLIEVCSQTSKLKIHVNPSARSACTFAYVDPRLRILSRCQSRREERLQYLASIAGT